MEKETCETCFWISREGYCTEGGRPPEPAKEPCDKYKPTTLKSTK